MIEDKRWGIIYNPKAGTRKVQKRWKEIREYLRLRNVAFDYVQSESFNSIERLSCMLANNGYQTIVIVGGDGALNDAINGIMNSKADKDKISLGVIPNGIGNDFAAYWGIESDDYKKAIDYILTGRVRKVDVGTCNCNIKGKSVVRYFLNSVHIGLGARVVGISNSTYRFWGIQTISFWISLILLMFERKLYRTHLKINGEHIREYVMTVCIGNSVGYGLTPSAVPYNGWLDVSILSRPRFMQLFSEVRLLLQGRILNSKSLKLYRTKQIMVLRAQNAQVCLDGRLLDYEGTLRIGIVPEAINFIIP